MVALEALRESLVHLDGAIDDLSDCVSENDEGISENEEHVRDNRSLIDDVADELEYQQGFVGNMCGGARRF